MPGGGKEKSLIEIELLRQYSKAENIVVTAHSRKRLLERGILLRDIMQVIAFGEIIEQYPEDYPFPSALLLGMSVNGKYLHVVLSMDGQTIYLITAYHPDPEAWEPDMKTRKERKL